MDRQKTDKAILDILKRIEKHQNRCKEEEDNDPKMGYKGSQQTIES